MPAIKETKQERLRRKLVNNEINPIVDALLTIFLISVSQLTNLTALYYLLF
jgi:hypothetical protein